MRKFLPPAILIPILAFGGDVWRPLFDGKDLDGWSVAAARGESAFTVGDGAIRTAAGHGLLWYTRERFGNATIRVIYRISAPAGNSGVFLRIPSEPTDEDFAIRHGIKVPFESLSRAAKPAGEWNTLDITLAGPRAIVKLNGALAADSESAAPAEGYLALSCSGGHATIEFREVSVKP